jgi:hypothetical protein
VECRSTPCVVCVCVCHVRAMLPPQPCVGLPCRVVQGNIYKYIISRPRRWHVVGTCRRPEPLEGSVHAQIEHQTPFGATFAMRLASLACFRRDLVGSR